MLSNLLNMTGARCKYEDFGLQHSNPVLFFEPQKGGASLAYVIYRQVVAVYFGLHIVYVVYGSVLRGSVKGLVFFTVWALIVLTLNVVLQAVVSLMHYKNLKHNNHDDASPRLKSVQPIIWVLQNLTFSSAILVTVVFWPFIYPRLGQMTPLEFEYVFCTHGVNGIYVMFDMFLTGIPVRLQHFYQVLLLSVIYAAVTGFYWAAGNSDPIYPFLDYTNQPSISVIWWCALLASAIVAHCLMFGLYRLRLFVCGSCARERAQPTPHEVEVATVV